MKAFIGLFTRSWLALEPPFGPVCPVDVFVWCPGEWRSVSIIMLYIHLLLNVTTDTEKKSVSRSERRARFSLRDGCAQADCGFTTERRSTDPKTKRRGSSNYSKRKMFSREFVSLSAAGSHPQKREKRIGATFPAGVQKLRKVAAI